MTAKRILLVDDDSEDRNIIKEAMELAARENAASQRSIFELQDLLQKITLHEKIDESREFANRVQSAM